MNRNGLLKPAWLDRLGAALSASCAVHCVVTPWLIAVLPLGALGFLESESVEMALVGLSLTTAAASFGMGFFQHRRHLPAFIAVAGTALILTAVVAEQFEAALLPLGALTLGAAHLVNHRASRASPQRLEHG